VNSKIIKKVLENLTKKSVKRLTALILVTISFINALRRAFDKLYKGDKPDQIWIVFISVLHKDKATYYYAEYLA
jgi:uncharacterized BrkB/YihY/UPF0761 family membrane protein